jgi:hypothetical protein
MPVDLGRPIAPIEEVDGGAVTVQQKAGKEAQPCAPARCWAYCFLHRKEGGREGPVRELRAIVRESGSRRSRTGADSVAFAEGPRGCCVDSAGP